MSELDDIRDQAAKEAWTLARVVREIEAVDMHERSIRDMLRAAKDQSVPALLDAMRTRRGFAKQNASVMLLHLGDPRGTEGIVDLLVHGDDDARICLLAHLGVLPFREPSGPWASMMDPPVPIDRAAVEAALVPLIDDPASHLGGLALDVLLRFGTEAAAARAVASLLEHPSARVRKTAIGWYADRHDPRALDAIGAMLLEDEDESEDYWLIQSLESYASGPDAGSRARAAEIAAAFVRRVRGDDVHTVANHVANALRVVEHAAPPWEAKLLAEVVASDVLSWARAGALARLASLEGPRGEERLVRALDDAELRQGAATSLAARANGGAAGARDRLRGPLTRALDDELSCEEPHRGTIHALVEALVACGLASEPVVDRAAPHLAPWDRTRVAWLREGVRARDVAARLVRDGVLPALDEARLAEVEAQWDADRSAMGVVFSLFGDEASCVALDLEAPVVPPDYVDLVTSLGRIARGALAIDCAVQEPIAGRGCDDDVERITVRVVERDRVVRFFADYRGDWFDLAATLAALDQAIATARRPERFFALHTGDQTCFVICAHGEKFRRAATDLHIPFEEDADAGVRCGIAFERHGSDSLRSC